MTIAVSDPQSSRPPSPTRRVWLAHVLLLCGAAAVAGRPVFPARKLQTPTPPLDPFKANAAFNTPISVEAYYVSPAQLIKQITPPDFPYLLHVAPDLAETPVHVRMAKTPLRFALNTFAHLLNGQWRKENGAKGERPVFVLEQTAEAIAHEEALYTATIEQATEPMVEVGRKALRRPFSFWKSELETVRNTKPEPHYEVLEAARFMGSESGYAIASLVATLGRKTRTALMETGCHVLPWETLTLAQQEAVLAAAHIKARMPGNEAMVQSWSDTRRDYIKQWGTALFVAKSAVTGGVRWYGLAMGAGNYVSTYLTAQSLPLLPLRGNPYQFVFSDTKPVETPPNAAAEPVTAELQTPFPLDVTFANTDTWADVLQMLTSHLPFAMVSDAYTTAAQIEKEQIEKERWWGGSSKKLKGMKTEQALDALCGVFGYLWWYEPRKNDTLPSGDADNNKGVLFFRRRVWFVEKQYETPTAVEQNVARILSESGGDSTPRQISVALVDSIASLTLSQIQGIMGRTARVRDFMAGCGENSATAPFLWLRFWQHLSPAQKQKIITPYGLPATLLTASQRGELIRNAIASGSGLPLRDENGFLWNTTRLFVAYDESQHGFNNQPLEYFRPIKNEPPPKKNDLCPPPFILGYPT